MTDPIDQLESWDRTHLWHAFTQMKSYQPFIIERAEDCYLYDIHGNRYLDAESSLWCNLHGHRHPKLDGAIRDQLDRVAHVTLLGMSSDVTVRLSKRLTDLAPGDLNHVFFSSDGACANEVALKMAFQYWRQVAPDSQKHKFLCFDAAYHGDTIGTVSVGGVDRFNQMFAPLLLETVQGLIPDSYRLPAGAHPENAAAFYLERLEQLLKEHSQHLAACIVEPLVQCAAGIVTQPSGFLRGVQDLCRKYEVLLIADEVAVGFGRTGTMFACEQEEVQPDFLCLGKGITAGYLPLSATLTHGRIWEAFLGEDADSNAFYHGHTYGGNPLAAAVALANLELFEEEQVLSRCRETAAHLADRLQAIADHPNVGDIRQRGLIVGVEIVADKDSKKPFPWQEKVGHKICQSATSRGVWLRPLEDVIVLMPPLAITMQQVDEIMDTLVVAINETIPQG